MTNAEFNQKIAPAKQLKAERGGVYLATQEHGETTIEITATDAIRPDLENSHRWVATRSIVQMRKHMVQRDPYFCYRVV